MTRGEVHCEAGGGGGGGRFPGALGGAGMVWPRKRENWMDNTRRVKCISAQKPDGNVTGCSCAMTTRDPFYCADHLAFLLPHCLETNVDGGWRKDLALRNEFE